MHSYKYVRYFLPFPPQRPSYELGEGKLVNTLIPFVIIVATYLSLFLEFGF